MAAPALSIQKRGPSQKIQIGGGPPEHLQVD